MLQNLTFVFLLLFISRCSTLPDAISNSEEYSWSGDNTVYIVSHGWHTGIVIPADKVFLGIPELKSRFENAVYIEFGWGDKGFYQANEITTGLTVRAIFWPTEAVIHAVGLNKEVKEYFPKSEIENLQLTDKELSLLTQFISKSFKRDKANLILPTKKGIYGDSQFYMGQGDYYLTNTCNKWTAKGLQSIGMNISPMFKLTSSSVMDFIKDYKERLTVIKPLEKLDQ